MMYTILEIKGKEYKLRLNTRNTVELEKRLGMNPLSIFGEGDVLPTITTMVTILWASLQAYHHGISITDAYEIFDDYLEENSMTDFVSEIVEIFKVSGLIKEEDEKNV